MKQLATSERKKKVEDRSLAAMNSVHKESDQNQRILDELIEEAKEFDFKLKNMGLNVSVKDLIKEDPDDDSRLARASQMADYDDDE